MKDFGNIDIEFLRRSNKPGPRYTSYPTAPMFSHDFSASDFKKEVIKTNKVNNSNPISLYLHFPYCEKLCYFCGCNMLVTKNRDMIRKYNGYLKSEINYLVPFISKNRKVEQMHWGGGTPSLLQPDEILEMGNFIRASFEFSENAELSVEIDPRGLTYEHLEAFSKIGFERASFGVQDFNFRVQKAINRMQSEEVTRQTIAWTRELGYKSINLDLIYGLPYQNLENFTQTVEKVIDISPDRIAVFNYAHVPWLKKHQKMMRAETLPSSNERLRILKMTIEKLTSAGFEYIGMDHFAKSTDALALAKKNKSLNRNFQGYSTKAGCDVYAFGLSAISQFENIYAQNLKSLRDYYKRIDEKQLPAVNIGYRMTFDDHVRKETINQLMCHLEIDKRSIERKFDVDFEQYFMNDIHKLDAFVHEDILENNEDKIIVKGSGALIIRNIAMCFDAYLENMMKEPVFSKTV